MNSIRYLFLSVLTQYFIFDQNQKLQKANTVTFYRNVCLYRLRQKID